MFAWAWLMNLWNAEEDLIDNFHPEVYRFDLIITEDHNIEIVYIRDGNIQPVVSLSLEDAKTMVNKLNKSIERLENV